MTTEASTQAALVAAGSTVPAATQFARPYPPSWVNRILDWMERLPGPTWLAYLGLGAISIAGGVVSAASSGKVSSEDLAFQVFWGVFQPLSLWLVGYLGNVAESAFDTYRPALHASADEADRIRYELTVIPARPAAIILVLTAILTPVYYVADPVGSLVVGLSPLGIVLRWVGETLFGALLIVLVVHSIRQLRAVSRIHGQATRVDLFRPAPLYAFSTLTSRTAIVIALVFLIPTMVAMSEGSGQAAWIWVPYVAAGVVAAAAVFVLPLRGAQRRIVAEKSRLEMEVGQRLEATIDAVHQAVDHGEFANADALNKTLATLMTERELVHRLPTWPWQPGTIGAVVSAIVLPIGLWLATRLLERLV